MVELAALLAVDDVGRVVAELLDLLNPELDLDEVVDGGLVVGGGLVGPLPGFVDASLLVVAVVPDVDALVTAGLGLALEVELALEGCLDTVLGVGRGLAAAGRGAVDDEGRLGSVLVSAATLPTGLDLDGLVLGIVVRGVLGGGLATPFSVGLVARGFLSPILGDCCGCFTVRLKASVVFSVVVLVGRAAAPTVEELGLDPDDLGAVELVGLLGPTFAVGLVVAALPAAAEPAGLVVVLFAVLGPALLLSAFPVDLLGEVFEEPSFEAAPFLFVVVVGLDWGVGGSTDILGGFDGVGGSTFILGKISSAVVTVASSITPFSCPGEISSSSTLVSVNFSPPFTLLAKSGVLDRVGVAGVI